MYKKILIRTARERLILRRRKKRFNQLMKKMQYPNTYTKLQKMHIKEMELMEIHSKNNCDK